MTPRLIDSHCHLHLPAYDTDRDAVILRMREQRIAAITVGTNGKSSIDAIALAEHEPDIFATVGFHPSKISGGDDEYEKLDVEPYSIERLKAIATSSRRVVASEKRGLMTRIFVTRIQTSQRAKRRSSDHSSEIISESRQSLIFR